VRALLIVAAFAIVVGCAEAETGEVEPRLGGTWTASTIPGLETFEPLLAPRIQITLGGLIQGAAGCADFSARVEFAGEAVQLGPINSRIDPRCDRDRQVIGAAFFEALLSAERVSGGLPGNRLTFSGPVGDLVFAQPRP
jgi:heat shock protein HslJ